MIARLFVACGLLAALPAASPAALIIGNYPPANDTGGVSTGAGPFITFSYATAFTMTGDYDLTSATARLMLSTPGITLTGRIFSDAGGNPGATLFTLTTPAFTTGSFQDLMFTATGPTPLTAGTTYWLVTTFVTPAGGGSFAWAGSVPQITPTGPGAVQANGFRFGGTPTWFNAFDSTRPTYQLDGVAATAVPAPAGLVLLGLGLPALGLVRRAA